MTPIYKFEEELVQDYDFEPFNDGYNIDDLKESDRKELTGMLYAFYNSLHFFENEIEANEQQKTIGQLRNDYLEEIQECFEQNFVACVNEFVVSCLDSYE